MHHLVNPSPAATVVMPNIEGCGVYIPDWRTKNRQINKHISWCSIAKGLKKKKRKSVMACVRFDQVHCAENKRLIVWAYCA